MKARPANTRFIGLLEFGIKTLEERAFPSACHAKQDDGGDTGLRYDHAIIVSGSNWLCASFGV